MRNHSNFVEDSSFLFAYFWFIRVIIRFILTTKMVVAACNSMLKRPDALATSKEPVEKVIKMMAFSVGSIVQLLFSSQIIQFTHRSHIALLNTIVGARGLHDRDIIIMFQTDSVS